MSRDLGAFRFFEPLRVRWAEVDMQRVVFNGHYLMYVDTAVAGYWRAMALPYNEALQRWQGDLFVRKAALEYLRPARYDDVLRVGIRCGAVGRTSFTLHAAVCRGDEWLVSGEVVYVFTDLHATQARPLPDELIGLLKDHEAGTPMFSVECGGWAEWGAQAAALRQAVLVDELRIAAPLAADAGDESAFHALARNRLGMPLATGRAVWADDGKTAHIGRMAVMQAVRGSGVGSAVLVALLAAARRHGARRALLHAHSGAVAFYAAHGFAPLGPVFDEAGLAHQTMVRDL